MDSSLSRLQERYVGRKQQIKRIWGFLSIGFTINPVLHVHGPPSTGKTSIVRFVPLLLAVECACMIGTPLTITTCLMHLQGRDQLLGHRSGADWTSGVGKHPFKPAVPHHQLVALILPRAAGRHSRPRRRCICGPQAATKVRKTALCAPRPC